MFQEINVFVDKVCFPVKFVKNKSRTWILKVIALKCLGKIYFLQREWFFSSLFRWRTCALLFVADMLSQMGSCFGTFGPSGLKFCCIYDTDSYLFSQRTNALVLPFVFITTNARADCSPDWDLPRSQEPVVRDCRSKFSCIFKTIQVN